MAILNRFYCTCIHVYIPSQVSANFFVVSFMEIPKFNIKYFEMQTMQMCDTVNSEIFTRDLYPETSHIFRKIKPLTNGEIILLFTDIGNSNSRKFFNVANMSFNNMRGNKIIAKIPQFTVCYKYVIARFGHLCVE